MDEQMTLEECTFTLEGDSFIWKELFPDLLVYDYTSGLYENREDIDITIDMLSHDIDLDFFREWYDAANARELVLFLVNEAATDPSSGWNGGCPVYLDAYHHGRYVSPPLA